MADHDHSTCRHVAVDGRAAIEYPDRAHRRDDWRPPRLVLLDLNLPRLSGFEVLRWARQHPVLRRLPIVVLTSSDEPADIAAAYDLGANSYVVKPRRVADLADVVRRFREYWLELNASPPVPRPGARRLAPVLTTSFRRPLIVGCKIQRLMHRKAARRRSPPVPHATITKLERSLKDCADEIERLKREYEITLRRMGSMQAEIDHLRAQIGRH